MAVKEVTRTYTAYDYVWKGKCPECGKEQSSEREEYADVLCTECLFKNIENKIYSSGESYVGSVVIDYKKSYMYPELTLLTPNLSVCQFSLSSPVVLKLNECGIADKLGYNNKEEELQKCFGYIAAKKRNDVPLYKNFLSNIMSKFKGE